jgi:DnaJ family protein C protein 7
VIGCNSLAPSEAFQIDKKSPEVLCLRGLVLFLLSKLPSALQHVQQALTYDPENTRARKLMKRIKDVERLKEAGNTFFKGGKLTDAVEKYTEALVIVGEQEEANGGSIRATLLSNRATALLKVCESAHAMIYSVVVTQSVSLVAAKRRWPTRPLLWNSFRRHTRHCGHELV